MRGAKLSGCGWKEKRCSMGPAWDRETRVKERSGTAVLLGAGEAAGGCRQGAAEKSVECRYQLQLKRAPAGALLGSYRPHSRYSSSTDNGGGGVGSGQRAAQERSAAAAAAAAEAAAAAADMEMVRSYSSSSGREVERQHQWKVDPRQQQQQQRREGGEGMRYLGAVRDVPNVQPP